MADDSNYRFDYSAVRAAVRARYSEWICVYSQVETKTRALQHEIEIERDNLQELLIAVLYVRTLATVSAAMVIAECGFDVQSRMLLRSAMETLFSMRAIEKDSAIAEAFTRADELERKRMLRKARSLSAPDLRAEAALHATDEKLREIDEAVKAADVKRLSVEELAKAAGLHDMYLTAYAVFSGSVHGNVRDLERHLLMTDDGDIDGIRNEPVLEELDKLFLTGTEILLQALVALSSIFGLNTERFRVGIVTRLQELACGIEG